MKRKRSGARSAGIPRRWIAAAVQMTSTDDVEANLGRAVELVGAAARNGARLVALPENFAYLREEGARPALRETLEGRVVSEMRGHAARHGVHVLLGSIPERIGLRRRVHNTSVLIGPSGEVLAVYRKMHLFDVHIPRRVVLRESANVVAGDRPVVATTSLGRLGLSICYDLRFPELYRHLVLQGAEVLFVPSAFTSFTGPHHWLPLLRARAIENQCWVVAPAQVGRHSARRSSHGETVIIDPWGAVVAGIEQGEGFVCAEIDRERTRQVRASLPCLGHLRRELLGVRTGRGVRVAFDTPRRSG